MKTFRFLPGQGWILAWFLLILKMIIRRSFTSPSHFLIKKGLRTDKFHHVCRMRTDWQLSQLNHVEIKLCIIMTRPHIVLIKCIHGCRAFVFSLLLATSCWTTTWVVDDIRCHGTHVTSLGNDTWQTSADIEFQEINVSSLNVTC